MRSKRDEFFSPLFWVFHIFQVALPFPSEGSSAMFGKGPFSERNFPFQRTSFSSPCYRRTSETKIFPSLFHLRRCSSPFPLFPSCGQPVSTPAATPISLFFSTAKCLFSVWILTPPSPLCQQPLLEISFSHLRKNRPPFFPPSQEPSPILSPPLYPADNRW